MSTRGWSSNNFADVVRASIRQVAGGCGSFLVLADRFCSRRPRFSQMIDLGRFPHTCVTCAASAWYWNIT